MSDAALAIAQFAPCADTGANLDTITSLAERAVARGAGLVVFPEYSSFFTPDLGPDFVAAGEALDGPFVTALRALADRLRVHLVAGMAENVAGGRVHNTVVAVAPAAGVVASYRKQHLYDAFGQRESEWVAAGDLAEPETFTWGDFTVGMQTCYDIRFPEVTRRLVDAGAEIVLCPAEWVRGPLKEHHWRTLVTARALENTVYLAAADHAPPVGAGTSMIVDPMGVDLVVIGEERQGVALAWPSRERLDAVRALNPALALRRYRVVPR